MREILKLDFSDEEPLLRPVSGKNVVRRVSDAVERSIGDLVQVSRKVVLAPISRNPTVFAELCEQQVLHSDSRIEFRRLFCFTDNSRTPHVLDEAGVLGSSATLLDDLECDLTGVDTERVP